MKGRVFPAVFALATSALALGCGDSANADKNVGAALLLAASVASVDGGAAHESSAAIEDTAIPPAPGEELTVRMKHLLEAVAQNSPDLAGDALFPREGYVAAKDAPDPQKLWEKKVSNPFRRNVERTHKRLSGAEHARFVSFELGPSIVQLTPKRKDFKKPLWRVKHARLSFTIDGKAHHIDIAEMTAWRGAWYVTRLR